MDNLKNLSFLDDPRWRWGVMVIALVAIMFGWRGIVKEMKAAI